MITLNGKTLFPYQDRGIGLIREKLKEYDSVCVGSPGGSGKAVIAATISQMRLTSGKEGKICIFVHSHKLFDQMRETLYDWYGIYSQKIDAETVHIGDSKIMVCMVQTFKRRITPKFLSFFSDCSLLIIDEVHRGDFIDIIKYFPCKRIGFTATPESENKDEPLNKYWSSYVQLATKKELFELNQQNPLVGIVPNVLYSPKNVDRNSLKIKGIDFDEKLMGKEFSKSRPIENAIHWYSKLAFGLKTICFNCDIAHSIEMNEACKQYGIPSRHIDSKKSGKYGSDKWVDDTYEWFKNTDNAFLNNVGKATTGYDEKSIQHVMYNRSTKSKTLWEQSLVRGARPYKFKDGTYKEYYIVTDMGRNAPSDGGNLGDCNSDDFPNWEHLFWNPKKKSDGVSPVKICPECQAMNRVSSRLCKGMKEDWLSGEMVNCNYEFPVMQKVSDLIPIELVRFFSGINVKACIEYFKDGKEFRSYNELIRQIIELSRKNFQDYLEKEQIEFIFEMLYMKIKEWFREKGRRPFQNMKYILLGRMIDELEKLGHKISREYVIELYPKFAEMTEKPTPEGMEEIYSQYQNFKII